MGFLWFVTVGWALFMSIFVVMAPGIGALICAVIGYGPLGLMVRFVFARASKREAEHAAILEAAGVKPGAGCDHAEGGTGIAVNKEAKTVSMHVKGVSKTYPFADIREWRSSKHTAGQVVAVGVPAAFAALGANLAAARQAEAASGFFVGVRDVDNPVWRIEMKNEQTQARWMEIFQQEINERK
jgi:hypothetical protein